MPRASIPACHRAKAFVSHARASAHDLTGPSAKNSVSIEPTR